MKKVKFSELESNPFFKVIFWKGEKGQEHTIHFLGECAFIMILKGEILLKSNGRTDFMSEGFHFTLSADEPLIIEILDSCEILFTLDSNAKLSFVK